MDLLGLLCTDYKDLFLNSKTPPNKYLSLQKVKNSNNVNS
ncbi:unnamed protein product [Brassica oleracea]|uniref:(rape) hypothetical protein n=1 Tax=Brassica napus TaxID=3708 RepID=A0A816IQL0_BRANA|nr:unnamed protein product [Brassica napus]